MGVKRLFVGWRVKHLVYPPHNCIPPPEKEEWDIEKLCAILVEKKIIPVSIQYDAQLYAVLIAQMELQLLRNLVVPKGVGYGNFYRNVGTKGIHVSKVTEGKNVVRRNWNNGRVLILIIGTK
jgi:hypothetical protein